MQQILKIDIDEMRLTKIASMFSTIHSKICIIGGGSGGLSVSSNLLKTFKGSDLRIFEPRTTHHYQSSYTLIGGGLASPSLATKPQKDIFSKDIPVTFEAVTKIDPTKNLIITERGQEYTYEQLIVLAGAQLDWEKIKGAREAVEEADCPVTSIYTLQGAIKTNTLASEFKGGRALFTEPEPPIKCGAAPQKILYLSAYRWIHNKVPNLSVEFDKAGERMFGVPKYAESLSRIAQKYQIDIKLQSKLVEVKKSEKIAVFNRSGRLVEEKFDFLHLVPPMKPPTFIVDSGLADSSGFVDVDKHTLRHKAYQNVWAAGDCSSLPCSKSAAAMFSQANVLVGNLKDVIANKEPTLKYDGYTCCPIFVGGKKVLLAEFKYNNELAETFFKDQEIPRTAFYYLMKDIFPFVYWKLMPRGLWLGKKGLKMW